MRSFACDIVSKYECVCVYIRVCVKQLFYGMMFWMNYFNENILLYFHYNYFLFLVGNLFFNPNKNIAKTISTWKFLVHGLLWMILREYDIFFVLYPLRSFSYYLEDRS